MTVTAKRGKVIIRLGGKQCTLAPDKAVKAGLALLDAGKKAAKRAKQFQEA